MKNITYLIGAGASAGKRWRDMPGGDPKDNSIYEGLPCVNEMATSITDIILLIVDTEIPKNLEWMNPRLGLNSVKDWEEMRAFLLARFEDLRLRCVENATIDTYAKKLILKGEKTSFKYLEQMLTLFFIYVQLENKPDSRYDTFLANVLERNMHFPDNIRVISWNYDSQFEIAYYEYNQKNTLLVGSKRTPFNIQHEITKINGTATFLKQDFFPKYRKEYLEKLNNTDGEELYNTYTKNQKKLLELIYLYKLYIAGSEDNTDLSFAFDETVTPSAAILESIDEIIKKTDVLVIIGYTFPFFNRKTDKQMLQNLKPEAKVYIQDKYPNRIKQNFKAVKADIPDEHIELKEETDLFFLPPEL